MKRNLEGVNGQIFSQHVENWLIFSIFSHLFLIQEGRQRKLKNMSFSTNVRVLTWLFLLPFEETHFYSRSNPPLFMMLHTCVFCQNFKKVNLIATVAVYCMHLYPNQWLTIELNKRQYFLFSPSKVKMLYPHFLLLWKLLVCLYCSWVLELTCSNTVISGL